MTEPTTNPTGPAEPAAATPSYAPPFRQSWAGRAWHYLTATGPGRYQAAFLGLLLGALLLRLWELSGRVMHYDEAIHVYASWRLANFEGYLHSPWMHGPFQIELVALFLKLLGDTDFIARLAYVLFGVALVGLPYFLREHLGRTAALLTGLLLALSPALLYFSRFGRNDIIMAFLAASLFILLWRYHRENRNRYLYLAAVVLALAFASKETAYIITVTFGALAFLMALPYASFRLPTSFPRWGKRGRAEEEPAVPVIADPAAETAGELPESTVSENAPRKGAFATWVGWLNPRRLSRLNGAGGFLLLLVTLTLPQWSAGVELARSLLLAPASALFGEGVAAQPFFNLDLVNREGATSGIVGSPLWEGPFVALPLIDLPLWGHILGLLVLTAGAVVVVWKLFPVWKGWLAGLVLPLAVALFLAYLLLFLPIVNVDAWLSALLPDDITVTSPGNAVPVNFLIPLGVVGLAALLSVILGLHWQGRVWLICAIIFYFIWITLYTTFYTNFAGVFSGVWQGLGYWIAQQDVARGNQPWYYYFVGLSVYEFLPLIFGLLGAAIFVKRRDRLGIALTFWALVNLLAYTVASEKMPWLLVNITLPFIFLAGKLLGELVERVQWRQLQESGGVALLCAAPLALAAGVYALLAYADRGSLLAPAFLAGLLLFLLLALISAWLVRRAGEGPGPALAGLGIAALLLAFTVAAALRAAYTYDDAHREILVYAQGSADLLETYRDLESGRFTPADAPESAGPALVDYDVWYPFQWYVRHAAKEGSLQFTCFKDEGGAGGCQAVDNDAAGPVLLVAVHHRPAKPGSLSSFSQNGPRRNLLWFPETYRRPGEDRPSEDFREEVVNDLRFFRQAAGQRESWGDALNYWIYREMDSDWFTSEYYVYRPKIPVESGPAP